MIDEAAVSLEFVRASGPGGQNVNKVSSAVQLRYDLVAARHPDDMKHRAAALAGSRLTNEGVIVLQADRFRTQAANRQDALDRLDELLREASMRPKPRRPTRNGSARSCPTTCCCSAIRRSLSTGTGFITIGAT